MREQRETRRERQGRSSFFSILLFIPTSLGAFACNLCFWSKSPWFRRTVSLQSGFKISCPDVGIQSKMKITWLASKGTVKCSLSKLIGRYCLETGNRDWCEKELGKREGDRGGRRANLKRQTRLPEGVHAEGGDQKETKGLSGSCPSYGVM